ncbi:MAG TPA: histidine phosphatase family protein, partial [Thauera sp.]|nr:histidine phosphatase family protein [Thauera sp.]
HQPQAWQHFKRRDPMVALAGGGESLGGLAARVHAALEEIAARHAGEAVVVVTHGGVLDIAHRLATGKALEAVRDFAIPNAALNWIEHSAGSWKLLTWADESHLTGALDELPSA